MAYRTQGGAVIEITASDDSQWVLWKCPCGDGREVRRGEAPYWANRHAQECHWMDA